MGKQAPKKNQELGLEVFFKQVCRRMIIKMINCTVSVIYGHKFLGIEFLGSNRIGAKSRDTIGQALGFASCTSGALTLSFLHFFFWVVRKNQISKR